MILTYQCISKEKNLTLNNWSLFSTQRRINFISFPYPHTYVQVIRSNKMATKGKRTTQRSQRFMNLPAELVYSKVRTKRKLKEEEEAVFSYASSGRGPCSRMLPANCRIRGRKTFAKYTKKNSRLT